MLTDSNMASGISPAHADVHVVTWATYIKALGCIRNTVRLMALCGYTDRKLQLVSGGYMCHSHQHGSPRQQNLRISQRHWAVHRPHVSI